jgi:hypothetical protein
VPRQDPGLRSATATNAVGVKSRLTHARPGGDRLRSSRANPADQFLRICPPRRDLIQEPTRIPMGWPHSQLTALGRSSAQYSFYVPGRTSHPRRAVSRPRPRKFTNPLAERNRRGVQRACKPEPAHRRRLHDAGPGMLETPMERNRSPSKPPRRTFLRQPNGTSSCSRLGTRHDPFATVTRQSPRDRR